MNENNNAFKYYVIYLSVIAHFSSNKYNIMQGLLSRTKFVDSWNEKRFNTDGILFESISKRFPPSEFLKLLTVYFYIEGTKVHPSFIINDNFMKWESAKHDFRYIEETYIYDLGIIKKYCVTNKVKMKTLIHSMDLFSLGLKLPTIVILNELFDIQNKLTIDSILEETLCKKRKLYIDKLHKVFYSVIIKFDWKEITKRELNK